MRRRLTPGSARRQHGASLVDALVSFLVVAVGMVTTARLQSQLRLTADHARQRAEAVRLAQQEIEQLRAYVALVDGAAPAAGAWPSYTALASATLAAADAGGRNARYEIGRTLGEDAAASMKTATVSVGWADRQGVAQQLSVHSVIARNAPSLAAALAVGPAGRPVAPLQGRHIGIPAEASDLGDGRSAFKPVGAGSVAWLLDNRSGRITGRCSGIPATRSSRQLGAADLHDCTAAAALLLSGRVRFALASTVGTDAANGMPLATSLAITGFSGTVDCLTEAVKVVALSSDGTARREAVPVAAVPTDFGLGEWVELGDRQLRYHCAVTPAAAVQEATARWSGRATLEPQGWRVGIASGDRRICRFLGDAGSGLTSELNASHPDTYRDADQALQEQNFLVVDALQRCPVGGAGDPSNIATVQHQP